MRRNVIVRIAGAAAAITAFGIAGQTRAADLVVQVDGIVGGKGDLVVSLYKDKGPSTFVTAPLQGQEVKTKPGVTEVLFKGLVPGRYAAIAFQDVKGKGELETDSQGLPSAPHGRSGEPKGDTGMIPPSMDANGFAVTESNKTIQIHLK